MRKKHSNQRFKDWGQYPWLDGAEPQTQIDNNHIKSIQINAIK